MTAAKKPLWACHDCPETFTALAAVERHSDQTGHHRIDWINPEEDK